MTLIFNWFGPFDGHEIARYSYNERLHIITGKRHDDISEQFYYLGSCDGVTLRKKASTVTDERKYWYGRLEYAPSSLANPLDLIESGLAWVWEPHFREKKEPVLPGEPLTLVMHWHKSNGKYRRVKPAFLSALPNLLFWDGTAWFTGKI